MRVNKTVAALFSLALLVVPETSYSEGTLPTKMGDFYDKCNVHELGRGIPEYVRTYCYGYILGAFTALYTSNSLCIENPGTFGPQQLMQMFANWAQENPEFWDYPASAGIRLSLMAEYPCD